MSPIALDEDASATCTKIHPVRAELAGSSSSEISVKNTPSGDPTPWFLLLINEEMADRRDSKSSREMASSRKSPFNTSFEKPTNPATSHPHVTMPPKKAVTAEQVFPEDEEDRRFA